MTQKKLSKKEQARQESLSYLLTVVGIKPGDTIDCILRHVSQSGMMRSISLKHKGVDITFDAAKVLDWTLAEKYGHRCIKVTGCGMDMGFNTVYNLSRRLFPQGFKPADAGKSGRNGTDATEIDSDGGYALKQRWI